MLLNNSLRKALMSINGPPRAFKDLEDSARATRLGKADDPLHGVTSDAKKMDGNSGMEHYRANRKLAQDISHALQEKLDKYKLKDADGTPYFVLGWRLYPNKDSKHWQQLHGHTCGCGCAGAAPLPKRRTE